MTAWTDERRAQLKKLARDGRTGKEIALVMRSSRGRIHIQLRFLGISLKPLDRRPKVRA
jgi:hypothetical protein